MLTLRIIIDFVYCFYVLIKQTKLSHIKNASLEVVAHTFNPSTWEAVAEADGFLSSRPAWSTE